MSDPAPNDGAQQGSPAEPGGMAPRTAARLELARAVGGALVSPLRYAAHLTVRGRMKRELDRDVAEASGVIDDLPEAALPTDRPLRIFLGAAEASGEIHAAGLVPRLRARAEASGAPPPEITAIGGERLRALGIPTIADPVARAQVGFDGVLASLPYYVGLIEDAARHARETRPDVFVPVDSPALHVPLAHVMRRYDVPTCHVVAPQYWGWAPWRVRGYRKAVDLALTILPHEPSWYARYGVRTRHIGHPLLDALREVPVTTPDPSSKTLAVLPGSRHGVIRRNLEWMLGSLGPLRERVPDVDVAILQSTDEHVEQIEEIAARCGQSVRIAIGDLHGELAGARAAIAASGTIVTDLLHHRLPTVVIYRTTRRREDWLYRYVLMTPYFASTNLLAGREVLPEHSFLGEGPRDRIAGEIADAFTDEERRARYAADLEFAAERLGPAGALDRAAAHALALAVRPAAR
ncbi:MAG: hypothetical protein AAGI22_05640 [Planctomycetota bacterium]